ncbi:hypothetical protein CLF_102266 [Clonorchis sinensis]|uniref:Pol-related protein n=1 Tax=Clonorchis sinensis TaxID=79923 RepID=G7Y7M3_CLOSI|nr:hypothetical protein CLF_102266 [Clonorchis sinensis]
MDALLQGTMAFNRIIVLLVKVQCARALVVVVLRGCVVVVEVVVEDLAILLLVDVALVPLFPAVVNKPSFLQLTKWALKSIAVIADRVSPINRYRSILPEVSTGCTKGVILIERVQRAATKIVAGPKSMDYETRLAVLDLFSLEYRRLRGDLIFTYALFEQGLANTFFTVDPANTRRGHGERQPLNDKNKTDPGNLGESLDPVCQSVNPW